MSERLTFDVENGQAVIRKAALDHPESLIHEAEALRQAGGPGVVKVLRVEGAPHEPEALVLEAISGTDLTCGGLAISEVARLMTSTAETIARLHEAGVVHGNLAPEHVLVHRGEPVLCGFGAAVTRRGLDRVDGAWAAATAADVADLGRLLDALTTSATGDDALLRHALRRISERATRPDPGDRPPVEVLAASLRNLVSADGSLPATGPVEEGLTDLRPQLSRADADHHPRRRWSLLITGLGAVVVGAFAGYPALAGGPAGSTSPPSTPDSSASPPTSAPPTSAPSTTIPAPERIWPPECEPGCEVPTVTFDGVDYLAGGAGDLAVVADAGCDGVLEAIVVRPSTGAVYVFNRWPDPHEEVGAHPLTRVSPPVTDVSAAASESGCGEVVMASGGGEQSLPLADLGP